MAASTATVFFHVGLGKAASTYLQHAFFPALEGVRYVPRSAYKRAPDRIRASPEGPAWLVSREFDQQLERECRWFREAMPEADIRPIIVLRRQDAWLASQYRRHVKNGSPIAFTEFLDVAADQGLWHTSDACFFPKLQFLEQCFGQKPLVLFHEDLRANPDTFLASLAKQLGADYPAHKVSLSKVHTSYSEHQLRWMRRASRILFPKPIAHGTTGWLARRGRLLACYAVLYGSRLLPAGWGDQAPLIDPAELAAVADFYAADWQACLAYAKG